MLEGWKNTETQTLGKKKQTNIKSNILKFINLFGWVFVHHFQTFAIIILQRK